MPVYEMKCEACALVQDVVCRVANRDLEVCERCGEGPLTNIIRGVPTIGPTFSKPIVFDQVGLTFESKKEADAYVERTGNRPATESEWRQVQDLVRERADGAAQKLGYRDIEHRNAEHDTKTEKQHFVVGD